jgi:hypothetical protein
VNIETKEQSKQWMHTHQARQAQKVNNCLPARKLMAAVFWDRKGVLIMEFIEQGTTIIA